MIGVKLSAFSKKHIRQRAHDTDGQTILALLKRRAMTVEQMTESLDMKKEEIVRIARSIAARKIYQVIRIQW